MKSILEYLLAHFQWYRKITKGNWWKVQEDYMDDWGSSVIYWTRKKPEESQKQHFRVIILKEEHY